MVRTATECEPLGAHRHLVRTTGCAPQLSANHWVRTATECEPLGAHRVNSNECEPVRFHGSHRVFIRFGANRGKPETEVLVPDRSFYVLLSRREG